MNQKQKICLWIWIIVIVLMGLFPPIDEYRFGMSIEYQFILNANGPVVLSNLITQWLIASAIAGYLITYTFKDKKPKDEQKQ